MSFSERGIPPALYASILYVKIFTPEIYWNQKVDKELSLPTFIDVSGLEEQLSKSRHVQKDDNDRNSGDVQTDKNKASANKQAIELIIQGRLPDNCDLFALFENLNMGRKIEKATEIKGMAVDIIIVVVSGETMAIPQALLDDIYEEANLNQKKIPVFGVMTKKDKIDESVNIEEKTKEICQALSIDEEHFLLCRCYQSEKAEDLENDIRILEFFSKKVSVDENSRSVVSRYPVVWGPFSVSQCLSHISGRQAGRTEDYHNFTEI
ncbi:uncharacterized protein LOC134276303 [Saccostrea cucullata]|uniref:uncharacterized protein LOC134276303 n=1 Tax=Saccostrea cuccullata TaxID=36930 RepID=UPI002ED1D7F3